MLHHNLSMEGLLSLPNDVIELVGEHVIGTNRAGLREWCRVTSTCKRLWHMQLPESAMMKLMFLSAESESMMAVVLVQARQIALRVPLSPCCPEQVHLGRCSACNQRENCWS